MSSIILTHLIIEAKTALHCGGGEFNALQDSPIMRDFNALPVILGTTLCGLLRAKAKEYLGQKFDSKRAENIINSLFGDSDTPSKLIFSNALLLDENLQVCECLKPTLSPFLQHFKALPQRQHNAINEKGVCKDGAKYDKEVIFKGTRFKFSLEMCLENDDEKGLFFELLSLFCADDFRLGASSSKGLGEIKIIDISYEIFTLNEAYKISASLNEKLSQKFTPNPVKSVNFLHYELDLTPENVFIFGSGYGDLDADNIGVREQIVDYNAKNLSVESFLIPASSVKGTLSHRTLFYINQNLGNFIDKKQDESQDLDEKAAKIHATLFGAANSHGKNGTSCGKKGKILISDLYIKDSNTQIFAHNSVDRFSGAVMQGALFQEKTNFPQNTTLKLKISVKKSDEKGFDEALKAFEKALLDLCNACLPLGAMSSKGHGFFRGELRKDKI